MTFTISRKVFGGIAVCGIAAYAYSRNRNHFPLSLDEAIAKLRQSIQILRSAVMTDRQNLLLERQKQWSERSIQEITDSTEGRVKFVGFFTCIKDPQAIEDLKKGFCDYCDPYGKFQAKIVVSGTKNDPSVCERVRDQITEDIKLLEEIYNLENHEYKRTGDLPKSTTSSDLHESKRKMTEPCVYKVMPEVSRLEEENKM